MLDFAASCDILFVHLHGSEPPGVANEFGLRAIKAVRVRRREDLAGLEEYRVGAFLLDSYTEGAPGGTGTAFPWDLAAGACLAAPVILSGGLSPANVAAAIGIVRPWAVDVSSGVETAPGVKEPELMREFVRRAKCA